MNHTILTIGDRALGLGDGFILSPTILGLSSTNNVRHIGTQQCYTILKRFHNDSNIKIFNMDNQGHYFTPDHSKTYNLTYWDVFGGLCNFGEHALNLTRRIANLKPLHGEPLPDIPIPKEIDNEMKSFLSQFRGPIIVTAPLMSYWNKMIPDHKQVSIVEQMLKLGATVIQIGGNNVSQNMIHPKAINLVNTTSIDQTLALIKHCDVYFGGDSFCQHAAAFLKVPSVIYWCGTSPQDFGYNTSSNISHPEIATCQRTKSGRPTRWVYDYDYKDKNFWGSRNEAGWSCPIKLCEKAITVDEIIVAVKHELDKGKQNRNWNFYDYKYEMGNLSK